MGLVVSGTALAVRRHAVGWEGIARILLRSRRRGVESGAKAAWQRRARAILVARWGRRGRAIGASATIVAAAARRRRRPTRREKPAAGHVGIVWAEAVIAWLRASKVVASAQGKRWVYCRREAGLPSPGRLTQQRRPGFDVMPRAPEGTAPSALAGKMGDYTHPRPPTHSQMRQRPQRQAGEQGKGGGSGLLQTAAPLVGLHSLSRGSS